VVVYLDTFLELCKKGQEPKMKEPDNEFRWELNNLKKADSAIQRRLK